MVKISASYLVFMVTLCLMIGVESADDCSTVKCPPIPKHYEEFNCIPMKNEGDCCPTYFDCSHVMNRDTSKCHYGNHTIEVGESLPDEYLRNSCIGVCFCRKSGNEPASFSCSHGDCSRIFAPYAPPDRDGNRIECIVQRPLDECCDSDTVCSPELEKLETCEYAGEIYREGERIDLMGVCTHKCACGKGFNNYKTFDENPYCKRYNCKLAIRNSIEFAQGCIPVFDKSIECCFYEWRCPDETTTVLPNKTEVKESKQKCTFGKLTMNIGEVLSPKDKDDTCTTCECKVPPMPYCTKTC